MYGGFQWRKTSLGMAALLAVAAIGRHGLMTDKIEFRDADEAVTELVDVQLSL